MCNECLVPVLEACGHPRKVRTRNDRHRAGRTGGWGPGKVRVGSGEGPDGSGQVIIRF
jgi:hypothetical protein